MRRGSHPGFRDTSVSFPRPAWPRRSPPARARCRRRSAGRGDGAVNLEAIRPRAAPASAPSAGGSGSSRRTVRPSRRRIPSRMRWQPATTARAIVSWNRAGDLGRRPTPPRGPRPSPGSSDGRSTTNGSCGELERIGFGQIQRQGLELDRRLALVADGAARSRTGRPPRRTSGPRPVARTEPSRQLRHPRSLERSDGPEQRLLRTPASRSAASARRHGSRIAASPPARASGGGGPDARSRQSATRNSPPQSSPAGPQPVPSNATPIAGPGGPAVLGQAGGDVRVVVLDGDAGQAAGQRPARRRVVGVEIVRHGRRRHSEKPRQLLDDLLEEPAGLEAVEVADVRRRGTPRPPRARQTVFLSCGADGQQRRAFERQGDSPRATKPRARRTGCGLAGDDAHHRVVRAGVDLAVVREEGVGDARRVARAPPRRPGRWAPPSGCRWS